MILDSSAAPARPPLPPLVVLPGHAVPGVEQVGPGGQLLGTIDPRTHLRRTPPVLHASPGLGVLHACHTTDAHTLQYVINGGVGPQYRVNKPGLVSAITHGLALQLTWIIIDIDRADGQLADYTSELNVLLSVCAAVGLPRPTVYSTLGGARILWPVTTPIAITPKTTSSIEQAMTAIRSKLDGRISWAKNESPDPRCKDWTRVFRLPRVVRREGIQDLPVLLSFEPIEVVLGPATPAARTQMSTSTARIISLDEFKGLKTQRHNTLLSYATLLRAQGKTDIDIKAGIYTAAGLCDWSDRQPSFDELDGIFDWVIGQESSQGESPSSSSSSSPFSSSSSPFLLAQSSQGDNRVGVRELLKAYAKEGSEPGRMTCGLNLLFAKQDNPNDMVLYRKACGRWTCPDCAPGRRAAWHTALAAVMVPAAQLYEIEVKGGKKELAALKRRLSRAGASYVRILVERVSDGVARYRLILSAPITGATPFTLGPDPDRTIFEILAAVPDAPRPIHTSVDWSPKAIVEASLPPTPLPDATGPRPDGTEPPPAPEAPPDLVYVGRIAKPLPELHAQLTRMAVPTSAISTRINLVTGKITNKMHFSFEAGDSRLPLLRIFVRTMILPPFKRRRAA